MRQRWSIDSIALHWLGAGLIIGLVGAGLVMSDLPPDSRSRLLLSRMHTLGGLTLMVLTVLRLRARWRSPTVAPLPLSKLHRRVVGAVHALLYALIFATGMCGFLTGASSTWHEYLQGELKEPPALAALAIREVHEILAFALLGFVALHVAGVMLQELRRGNVLRRMVPFLK